MQFFRIKNLFSSNQKTTAYILIFSVILLIAFDSINKCNIDTNLLLSGLGIIATALIYLFTIKENKYSILLSNKNIFIEKLALLNQSLNTIKNNELEKLDENFLVLINYSSLNTEIKYSELYINKIQEYFKSINEDKFGRHIQLIDNFLFNLNTFCSIETNIELPKYDEEILKKRIDILLAKVLDLTSKTNYFSLSPLALRYLSIEDRYELKDLDSYISVRRELISKADIYLNTNSCTFIPYKNDDESRYLVQYFHVLHLWKTIIKNVNFDSREILFSGFFMMVLGIEEIEDNIYEAINGEFFYGYNKTPFRKEITTMYCGSNYIILRKALEYGVWGNPYSPLEDIYGACKDSKTTNTIYSYLSDFLGGQLLSQWGTKHYDNKYSKIKTIDKVRETIDKTKTDQDVLLVPFYDGLKIAVHLLHNSKREYSNEDFLRYLKWSLNLSNIDLPFNAIMHCFACRMLGLTMNIDLDRNRDKKYESNSEIYYIHTNDRYNYNYPVIKFLFAFRFYKEIENDSLELNFNEMMQIFMLEFLPDFYEQDANKNGEYEIVKVAFEKFMSLYDRGSMVTVYSKP